MRLTEDLPAQRGNLLEVAGVAMAEGLELTADGNEFIERLTALCENAPDNKLRKIPGAIGFKMRVLEDGVSAAVWMEEYPRAAAKLKAAFERLG